jgi:uncharacterized protein (TIGR01777 family)
MSNLFDTSPEHVLVTGATGFIGRLLVRTLLANGKLITVLTRNPASAGKLFNGKVQCVAALNTLPPDCHFDVIVNLAGARILGARWSAHRKAVLRQSRIGLTQTVIDWIARAQTKPRLLLSASAIGYYGIQPQGDDAQLSEDNPAQAIFMSQLCQEWEQCAAQASRSGVAVRLMRFGFVLGKQGSLPLMMLPVRLGLGGALGSGAQWLSWIHVEDILRAMAFLWNQPALAQPVLAFNFTAPQAVHQKQFMQIAAGILHRPCLLTTPALPVKVLLGEQAALLLEGQRVVPAALQALGFEFAFPALPPALKNLL